MKILLLIAFVHTAEIQNIYLFITIYFEGLIILSRSFPPSLGQRVTLQQGRLWLMCSSTRKETKLVDTYEEM